MSETFPSSRELPPSQQVLLPQSPGLLPSKKAQSQIRPGRLHPNLNPTNQTRQLSVALTPGTIQDRTIKDRPGKGTCQYHKKVIGHNFFRRDKKAYCQNQDSVLDDQIINKGALAVLICKEFRRLGKVRNCRCRRCGIDSAAP